MRFLVMTALLLVACGGTATTTTTTTTPTHPPTTTTAGTCGCTTETCRTADFAAYFEARFCTWSEATCACTDAACAQKALDAINAFKDSLRGETITPPPADVLDRTGGYADKANACLAKFGSEG